MKESIIQEQILNYLAFKGIFAWTNKSLGVFDAKKRIFRKPKSKWAIKGTSDILGILSDGRFLAIEVKRLKPTKGYASPEQKEFIANVTKHNGLAFIAYSVEDVEKELISCGYLPDYSSNNLS